jgi:acetyl coenzyme A synthetase (ADP forming)-like protein
MTSPLKPLFRPESIAVIGASRRPGTIGHQIIANLLDHGFTGVVYPVNPNARAVHSIPAYPSVSAIPDAVDLAVIAVPKEIVSRVVDECGEKGVPALVVITAGFREVGGEGILREARLASQVHRYGMRMVGPNCMGLLNTAPAVSMNATFAPSMPPAGSISFMSQSGAIGVTILDYAAEYGIGIHNFVSVGNKTDVSGNDLLEYWENDPDTRVVLMYLESFGNPRHFTAIASRVSRRKPIVVVKTGRTSAGARAASSHTGALAGLDVTVDALLAQCGILRAESVEALFDLAMAFGSLPIPDGNRVAIITNAGGPGIIIADTCESEGLEVVELARETQARLRGLFPEEASVRNPVDMIASATPESYRLALEIVLDDPSVDAAIAAFVPPLGVRQQDVAEAIVTAYESRREKPVLAVLMGREGLPQGRAELQEAGVPGYIFPESAARALAAMDRYRRWSERPVQAPTTFEVDRDRVSALLNSVEGEGRRHLTELEAMEVLGAYGIPTVEHRLAKSEEEALTLAEELGYPVVLKILSPDVVHKTELGGVAVDVRSPDELRAAHGGIVERARAALPSGEIGAVLVQEFKRGGRETIVGMSLDPRFGPVIMFGLGGIYVEALKDVAFRIQPVSAVDAEEMIRSIRGFKLLEEGRGSKADLGALSEVIQRVSQLVGDHHRIAELDINPFLAFEDGGVAVDARIRLVVAQSAELPYTAAPGQRERHGEV